MEDKENTPSVIEPQPTTENKTVHKTIMNQKGMWLPMIGIILLIVVIGVGGYFLGSKKNSQPVTNQPTVSQQPSATIPAQPTTPSDPSTWKTYTNSKYGYQVKYSTTAQYTEDDRTDYGHTNFLLGCFNVWVVPQSSSVPGNIGLTRENLKEIDSLQDGQTKTYSTPNWKGQQGFTYKMDYKKLPAKSIGDINWFAFEVTNNWENHGTSNLYFVDKSTYLYLISMLSYGPCYEDEPIKMLSTFKFTSSSGQNTNTDLTQEYKSPTGRVSFKYPNSWKILPAPQSYDGGTVIELQGPKQRLRIFDGGTPNYGFDDFKVENTTALIAGKNFSARKFTSQSFGNSFIDVKVQETPYKLYMWYGDAASVGLQGYNQEYKEKVNFDADIEPIQKILQTLTY